MKKWGKAKFLRNCLFSFLILLLLFQLLPNKPAMTKAADILQLTYSSSTWENGYNLNVTINNSSTSAINGWILTLKKSDFAITNAWCVKATSSGNSILITPETWNSTIPANGSVTFGFTGQGTFNKNFSYTLSTSDIIITPTTTPPVTPTDKPTVTPTVTPTVKPTATPPPVHEIQIPSFSSLQANAKLPDPFMFKTGNLKGTRITSSSEWASRRAEISALAQAFEFGVKPDKPQSVKGSYSNNSITVTCTHNGKTISFRCSIQYPKTGKAPYPAMIGINMNNLNTSEILNLGVACITFPADEIGQQVNSGSRGKGKFFDLYGSNYDAGALISWAWGVDRLIDALESTPSANINPARLGVTGGSRNGKGALAVGAFCERIALTVPQESGNGGASGWRTADAQKASGQNVQTLSQIIGENCWFSKSLNQFSGQTNKLPYDHHEIFALVAPRGLLVIENPDFEWLGNLSCYNTSMAGRMIFEALGVKNNMGYSSIGGHGHCVFPSSQQPELTAFIKKFLLDQSADTNVFRSDRSYTFDKAKWVNWTLPNF